MLALPRTALPLAAPRSESGIRFRRATPRQHAPARRQRVRRHGRRPRASPCAWPHARCQASEPSNDRSSTGASAAAAAGRSPSKAQREDTHIPSKDQVAAQTVTIDKIVHLVEQLLMHASRSGMEVLNDAWFARTSASIEWTRPSRRPLQRLVLRVRAAVLAEGLVAPSAHHVSARGERGILDLVERGDHLRCGFAQLPRDSHRSRDAQCASREIARAAGSTWSRTGSMFAVANSKSSSRAVRRPTAAGRHDSRRRHRGRDRVRTTRRVPPRARSAARSM